MAKKRDWKQYEKELGERKQKIADFILSRPTAKELLRELEKLNKRKQGRKYQVPKSVLLLFHFLKQLFRIDDRLLARFMSNFMNTLLPRPTPFDHSTIVKRREGLDLLVPSGITPENLNGKRLYFDGMCLRVGRGGYYRSKKYKTEVKYLRIGLFSDSQGKVVDFTIGDEHDAEIGMIKEKMPLIEKSRVDAVVIDGAGSAKMVVYKCARNKIKPIIRASSKVVESMKRRPPPNLCAKKKNDIELAWGRYVREQEEYQKWRKETGYSMRWVYSEGKISSFKRMFGEETTGRTQKSLHDEVCAKFLLLDGRLPALWG
jgi:hypothetical protein